MRAPLTPLAAVLTGALALACAAPDAALAAGAGRLLPADTLVALCENAARRALGPLPPDASVTFRAATRIEPLDVPEGELRIDVALPDGAPAAVMTPLCRVVVDGRVDWTVAVPLHARMVGPRFRATRRLEAGEALRPGCVERVVEEIPPPWGDAVTDSLLALGVVARRAIGAGEFLRADLVALPPVVRRGDRVTLVVESSTVRILTTGTARTEGRVGERIRVVRDGARRPLAARVVAPGRVVVEVQIATL